MTQLVEVRLRPFTSADVAAVDSFAADIPAPSAAKWIEAALAAERNELATRRITRAILSGGTVAGAVMLNVDSWEDRRAEVGFVTAPSHRRIGIATSGLRAMLESVATAMEIHRVWAVTTPQNRGAQTVLERCGFRVEGQLRDDRRTETGWVDSVIFGHLLGAECGAPSL